MNRPEFHRTKPGGKSAALKRTSSQEPVSPIPQDPAHAVSVGVQEDSDTKEQAYTKKGYYLSLSHMDTLDDLAKLLRRRGLPDDRSMIVRGLVDLARAEMNNAAWLDELEAACRQTPPQPRRKQGGKTA